MSSSLQDFIHPNYPLYVEENVATIQKIRNVSALALGAAAGILHLESYFGFLFYLMASFLVGTSIYFIVAKGSPKSYFVSPIQAVWIDNILSGLSGFVLTWTLFYGLVSA